MVGFKLKQTKAGFKPWASGMYAAFINPNVDLQTSVNEKQRYISELNNPETSQQRKDLINNLLMPSVDQSIERYSDAQGLPMYETQQKLYENAVGTAEILRKSADDHIMNLIAEDPEYQAAIKWRQQHATDLSVLWKPDLMLRGFEDLSVSMAMTLGPGLGLRGIPMLIKGAQKTKNVAQYLAGIEKANKLKNQKGWLDTAGNASQWLALQADRGSIFTMMIMEGSSQYNDVMSSLREEGVSPEDAIPMAAMASIYYAPVSGFLERMQVFKAGKFLGINKQIQKSAIMKSLDKMFGKYYKDAGVKSFKEFYDSGEYAKIFSKLGYEAVDFTANSFEEAYIEAWQNIYQDLTAEAITQGYGPSPEAALQGLGKQMTQEGLLSKVLFPGMSDDAELKEVFYSTLGGTAIPGGLGKISSNTGASSYISKLYNKFMDNGGNVTINDGNIEIKVGDEKVVLPIDDHLANEVADELSDQSKGNVNISNNNWKEQTIASKDYALALVQQISDMTAVSGNIALSILNKNNVKDIYLKDDLKGKTKLEQMIIKHAVNSKLEGNLGAKGAALIALTGNRNIFQEILDQNPDNKQLSDGVNEIHSLIRTHIKFQSRNKIEKIGDQLGQKKLDQLNKKLDNLSDSDLIDQYLNSNQDINQFLSTVMQDKLVDKLLKKTAEDPVITKNTKIEDPLKSANKNISSIVKKAEANTKGFVLGNINESIKSSGLKVLDHLRLVANKAGDKGADVVREVLNKANNTTLVKLAKSMKVPINKVQLQKNPNAIRQLLAQNIFSQMQTDPLFKISGPKTPKKKKGKPKYSKKKGKRQAYVSKSVLENAEATINLHKDNPNVVTKEQLKKAKAIIANAKKVAPAVDPTTDPLDTEPTSDPLLKKGADPRPKKQSAKKDDFNVKKMADNNTMSELEEMKRIAQSDYDRTGNEGYKQNVSRIEAAILQKSKDIKLEEKSATIPSDAVIETVSTFGKEEVEVQKVEKEADKLVENIDDELSC